MRVLLVEPQYRRTGRSRVVSEALDAHEADLNKKPPRNDDTLWYPPLGLMKLARFHRQKGDEVVFVNGYNPEVAAPPDLFNQQVLWDRVYITTLFTFHWDNIVNTIRAYKQVVGGTASKIFVGGIMASLMANELFEETGIFPISGVITSPAQIGLPGDENIDLLPPDYSIVDSYHYAINDTYYGYTTRGCVNRCHWCGVPRIEPTYIPYIDIKPTITALREQYGDKSRLKLMDNNVLASANLEQIIDDLVELGYGRGEYTRTKVRKQRVVDFNQGLDARLLTDKRMKLMSRLNIKPMRIAFDQLRERKFYVRALQLAKAYGVREFSNYMLFNWKDSPRELYDRLAINFDLNEKWRKEGNKEIPAVIYSYPMRFAPIDDIEKNNANKLRDWFPNCHSKDRDWLKDAIWTRRFVRNVEIMKGAAHGAISPTPSLAWRTVGKTYEEFLANLYMSEELLRNRNKHEKRVYKHEPKRAAGTGKVEDFRKFISGLLKKQDDRFRTFHDAVCGNSVAQVRGALRRCTDEEINRWLQLYLKN